MTANLSIPVVKNFPLLKGDVVQITFGAGYGFLIISQPNFCHVNFGQGCSSADSSSCRWYQMSRSDGMILFGPQIGIAEVIATSPGTFIITIGYHYDSCCTAVDAYSRVDLDNFTFGGSEKLCFMQTATSGTSIVSAAPIRLPNVSLTGLSPTFSRTWDWSISRSSATELTTLVLNNPTTGTVIFLPYYPEGKFFDSAGANAVYDYGRFGVSRHDTMPVIYTGRSTYIKNPFTAGRYVLPTSSRSPTSVKPPKAPSSKTVIISCCVISSVVIAITIAVSVYCCKRKQQESSERLIKPDDDTLGSDNPPLPGKPPQYTVPPPFLPASPGAYTPGPVPPYPYGNGTSNAYGNVPRYSYEHGPPNAYEHRPTHEEHLGQGSYSQDSVPSAPQPYHSGGF